MSYAELSHSNPARLPAELFGVPFGNYIAQLPATVITERGNLPVPGQPDVHYATKITAERGDPQVCALKQTERDLYWHMLRGRIIGNSTPMPQQIVQCGMASIACGITCNAIVGSALRFNATTSDETRVIGDQLCQADDVENARAERLLGAIFSDDPDSLLGEDDPYQAVEQAPNTPLSNEPENP